MEHKLVEMVTADQVMTWIVIAFVVGYFIYKEWPEIKRRISGGAVAAEKEAAEDRSVCERLTAIDVDIREIKEKLNRDFTRLNDTDRWKESVHLLAVDSLEEREILMQALLGVLGGLQEIGANGTTQEAEREIREYLNRKAHKGGHNI